MRGVEDGGGGGGGGGDEGSDSSTSALLRRKELLVEALGSGDAVEVKEVESAIGDRDFQRSQNSGLSCRVGFGDVIRHGGGSEGDLGLRSADVRMDTGWLSELRTPFRISSRSIRYLSVVCSGFHLQASVVFREVLVRSITTILLSSGCDRHFCKFSVCWKASRSDGLVGWDVSGYLSQVQGHGCDRGEALLQSDSAGMFRHSDPGEDGIPVEQLLEFRRPVPARGHVVRVDAALGGRGHRPGEAEVAHLDHAPLREEDVLRFDVPRFVLTFCRWQKAAALRIWYRYCRPVFRSRPLGFCSRSSRRVRSTNSNTRYQRRRRFHTSRRFTRLS
ncbi:hypothetical protein EYF80_050201 [Liparis tanakae]|uniref:Uncharacterized protein n=1 Tax=Liparis tanakae TaxID=230148 RepID=A0A4Z2FEG3_9TELE|nr:hypothetical protein EYF80_050201 [Liparis tanakae]